LQRPLHHLQPPAPQLEDTAPAWQDTAVALLFPQVPSTVPKAAAPRPLQDGVDLAALDLAMASQELIDTRADCRSALAGVTTTLLQASTNARPAEEVAVAHAALLAAVAEAGLSEELTALQIRDGNASRRTRLAVMHRVLPRLWVGQFEALKDDCRVLREQQVTHVVSVMSGEKASLPPDLFHLHVRVDDREVEAGTLAASFREIVRFIDAAISSGGVVFVHCGAGISRSVTAACAYIIWKQRISAAAAISLVRRARPCANPNDGFVAALTRWETQGSERDEGGGGSPSRERAPFS
jgi:predicted protein tyrosine phosphatase